jgi:lysophospholipase L1-like esterase
VIGPAQYSPDNPVPGGPSALARLDRDVIALSGVRTVVWLEGINDFSRNGNASLAAVQQGFRDGVARLRAAIPGVRVVGATVLTAFASSSPAHGHAEQDANRRGLNDFIRGSGLFDAVLDFDAAAHDPATGSLRAEMVPDSTIGAAGDGLHPNRAGYLAMGFSVDPAAVLPD